MAKKFDLTVKVYYEDTDSGGVVYYANYLKFLERARSEAIYTLGFTNSGLLEKHNILLIVKSCNIEYKKPAKFEDKINIISEVISFTKTSFTMKQCILRNNELITEANVHIVIVDKNGKPSKIPEELKQKLEN
jgi:acyl-CoA thioester hydrolase|tara:strand:+ start:578 stop:976 length:399 start_codon:yes stop_codon:yes gene_type:complete